MRIKLRWRLKLFEIEIEKAREMIAGFFLFSSHLSRSVTPAKAGAQLLGHRTLDK